MDPPNDDLAHLLYASLKAMPCRCQYARNAKGVPVWSNTDGELTRPLIQQCSRCKGIEEYERQRAAQ